MCEQQAFEMDFYKDKAKLIDKLLEEGPTSTEEKDEALVTLKRESRMQNKFFACHVVVLVLVLVLGMCLFARVAYNGFQTTGYDQQSLNGGLFILILGHSIYCPPPTLLKVLLYLLRDANLCSLIPPSLPKFSLYLEMPNVFIGQIPILVTSFSMVHLISTLLAESLRSFLNESGKRKRLCPHLQVPLICSLQRRRS